MRAILVKVCKTNVKRCPKQMMEDINAQDRGFEWRGEMSSWREEGEG